MTADGPSERYRWLSGVRATTARRARIRALRLELAAARAAGLAARHEAKLRRTQPPEQP